MKAKEEEIINYVSEKAHKYILENGLKYSIDIQVELMKSFIIGFNTGALFIKEKNSK